MTVDSEHALWKYVAIVNQVSLKHDLFQSYGIFGMSS